VSYCHEIIEDSVPTSDTEADVLLSGERAAALRIASALLVPLNDNFVERPWGGFRLRELKRVPAGGSNSRLRIGECFEIAADDRDAEARRYPSRIRLRDGSVASLPAVLDANAETLLGTRFVARHGRRWPLLPKTLDVVELLSVQAHPPGNTEVYVILSAEPGATLRLGFKANVDAKSFAARAAAGRRDQQRLKELCGAAFDDDELQAELKPWLADRVATPAALEPRWRAALDKRWRETANVLRALHAAYWDVLDLMNEIPVVPGQVIYNATPERITAARGIPRSAEIHALGNTQALEIVALEIRKPGTTYRAWDNVRFPLRDVDSAAAIAALNLERTDPEEFVVARTPVPGRPGVAVSVDSAEYRLEHLAPTATASIDVPAAEPHNLHALAGAVSVYASDGALVGRLVSGDSALVPIGVGAYRVVADAGPAEVLKVSVPDAR
jgi:mannose-6-phosphate isomerase class I